MSGTTGMSGEAFPRSSAPSQKTTRDLSSGEADSGAWRRESSRERFRVALLVAIASFALNLWSVAPTLSYGGDCGELISASYRLGITHPTGYPLYCLLGRTFASLLPLGDIAWRYNVLSALFGAGATALVAATAHRLTVAAPHEYSCGDTIQTDLPTANDEVANDVVINGEAFPRDHFANIHGINEASAAATRGDVANGGRVINEIQDAARRQNATRRSAWISTEAWPSVGAGLLLAGFYYFWTQSVIAEVYTLNALMLAALLYGAVAWHQSGDWRWMYSLAALFGLALNAHLSCVFMAPGLLLYVLAQHRERFGFRPAPSFARRPLMTRLMPAPEQRGATLRRVVAIFCFFAFAYALTLYLPIRARLFPAPPPGEWWPLDWTHPVNFANWYAHASAKQYKGLLFATRTFLVGGHAVHIRGFASPLSEVPGKLASLAGSIALLYLWCAPLILTGIARSFRGSVRRDEYSCGHQTRTGGRWLGVLLALTVLLNVGIEINYKVGDQSNFFFPTYIAIAVWLGLGLAGLWRALPQRATQWARKRQQQSNSASLASLPRLATAFLPIFLLVSIASQWLLAGPHVSRRGIWAARDTALERAQAMEKLEAANPNRKPTAILLGDDSLWSFWYAKYVLGRAPRTQTPWGLKRNKIAKENRLAALVASLQKQGPVAISGWNDLVDRHFPYVLLTPSGNLCLASHRVLPPPAFSIGSKNLRPADNSQKSQDDGGSIVQAWFPARQVTPPTPFLTQVVGKAPELKRENMYAFTLDFRTPWTTPLSPKIAGAPTIDNTSSPRAMHIGWLEVFLSPATPGKEGHFARPPLPAQDTIRKRETSTPPVMAWKQTRRLIVPQGVRAGTLLRMVVPLQMNTDAPAARYNVWLRLTRAPRDTQTPWHQWNDIEMTLD